jgi:hypothetical protein
VLAAITYDAVPSAVTVPPWRPDPKPPTLRWVVGDRAITGCVASASQMGRLETEWLARPGNLAALADLPGRWIDKVHMRRPPKNIVLDMDFERKPNLRRPGRQRLWGVRLGK